VLVALAVAGALEGRNSKRTVAFWGGMGAMVGFISIVISGITLHQGIFYSGLVLLGIGTGLSTVSNLSLMLDMTAVGRVGLFIGAWGMANAFSRLIGSVLGGAIRDIISQLVDSVILGYISVFGIMALMMLASLILLRCIDVTAFHQQVEPSSLIERSALATDAS
jgi:BCD family chlorophyll transporter-like MFS transporter